MLIGVVVTSIRWARRRLRYESWHLLHLYSYLGMGLALPHQIFDGVHFHELLDAGLLVGDLPVRAGGDPGLSASACRSGARCITACA